MNMPPEWVVGLAIAVFVVAAAKRQRRWWADSASTPNYHDAIRERRARPKTKGSGWLVAGAIVFGIVGFLVAGPVGAVVVVVIAVIMGISRSAENTRASANVQANILDELRRSRERAERAEAALAAQQAPGMADRSGAASDRSLR
jgi:ABC-type Fe3+ transport system permease subunit